MAPTRCIARSILPTPQAKTRKLEQGPQIYATAGIHPQEAHRATPEALAKLKDLAADPRCLAVGEIGLDYYHLDNPDPAIQHEAFVAQMAIAAAAGKPITIHCRTSELAGAKVGARFKHRDAWADLLALIAENWTPTGLPGIMHCFSGNQAQAEASLAAGFYLSFARQSHLSEEHGDSGGSPVRSRRSHPG